MIETRPTAAPTSEVVTPIKPSEALRLGRLMFPERITGHMFSVNGACALGCIVAGYGDAPDVVPDWHGFTTETDWDTESRAYDDARKYLPPAVLNLVWKMNDRGFTDDEIVRYLEVQGL